MAGPYNEPSLPTLQCSGVSVVPKKNGSWMLIMHLSAPRGLSINEGIDPEEYYLRYKKIDDAIAFVKQTGQGCCMAKHGLETCLSFVPCSPRGLGPTGSSWGQPILRRQALALPSTLVTSTI